MAKEVGRLWLPDLRAQCRLTLSFNAQLAGCTSRHLILLMNQAPDTTITIASAQRRPLFALDVDTVAFKVHPIHYLSGLASPENAQNATDQEASTTVQVHYPYIADLRWDWDCIFLTS